MFGIRRRKKGLTEERKKYYRGQIKMVEAKILKAKLSLLRLDHDEGRVEALENTMTVSEHFNP